LVQGELACVQGELFVVFELWFGGLRSLLDHSFVSDVSSRCPGLRGPRLASRTMCGSRTGGWSLPCVMSD
jgi:hypothetical protein